MRLIKTLLASGAAVAALSAGTAFANSCPAQPQPTAPSPCGAGGASVVDNTQTQNAHTDAQSEVSGHVVGTIAGNAAASANLVTVGAANTTFKITNNQHNKASATATATLQVTGRANITSNGAAATGNGMTVSTSNTQGYVDSLQVSGWGVSIAADSRTVARNVGISVTTAQAAANNANIETTGGSMKTDVLQYSASSVTANTKAELCCVDQGSAQAIAAGNTATTLGLRTRLTQSVLQSNTGAVRATSDMAVGRGGDVQAAAAASGNSNTAGTTFNTATVNANQTNSGDVQANAWLSGSWNGMGTASAYGVGNANDALNTAGDLNTTATQENNGTIRAWTAVSGGGVGSDSVSAGSAVAIGNSNSATLCTDCGPGTLRARNNQVNNGTVEAISRVNVGAGTQVGSSATATGNAASFFVGTPKH